MCSFDWLETAGSLRKAKQNKQQIFCHQRKNNIAKKFNMKFIRYDKPHSKNK